MYWNTLIKHCETNLEDGFLRSWIARLLMGEKVEILHFTGPRQSGVSMFHEALRSILAEGRHIRYDVEPQSMWNYALGRAAVVVAEEPEGEWFLNIATALELTLYEPMVKPRVVPNTTAYIQVRGNSIINCVTVAIPELTDPIPKDEMLAGLKEGATSFIIDILWEERVCSKT